MLAFTLALFLSYLTLPFQAWLVLGYFEWDIDIMKLLQFSLFGIPLGIFVGSLLVIRKYLILDF